MLQLTVCLLAPSSACLSSLFRRRRELCCESTERKDETGGATAAGISGRRFGIESSSCVQSAE